MQEKMNWATLHQEVTALNKDIAVAGCNILGRIKRVRFILQNMETVPGNIEPETTEVLRMLMTILESKFQPKELQAESEALQNMTTLFSNRELQESVEPMIVPESEEDKGQLPPELLY